MKTAPKTTAKQTPKPEKKKMSKLGKAMQKGILKDAIIENGPDIWGLRAV